MLAPDEYELGEDVAAFADRYPPPDDISAVDRTMRLLANMRADLAEVDARAESMRLDIDRWHDETAGPLRTRIEWLEDTLEDWARATGATKQVTTPHGVIRTRKGTPKLAVDDLEAAAAWLLDSGYREAVKLTPRLTEAKAALKAAEPLDPEAGGECAAVAPDTGEVVPGVRWVSEGRTYTVSVS
jgi:phage host-nuclease inhibitor protein Gam